MKTAADLVDIAFPQCSTECAAILHLGASECDSVCPHKFRQATGKPWAFENLSQNELDLAKVGKETK